MTSNISIVCRNCASSPGFKVPNMQLVDYRSLIHVSLANQSRSARFSMTGKGRFSGLAWLDQRLAQNLPLAQGGEGGRRLLQRKNLRGGRLDLPLRRPFEDGQDVLAAAPVTAHQ